jgi:hypothetical protein
VRSHRSGEVRCRRGEAEQRESAEEDCRPFGRGKAAKPDGVGETVFEVPFAD